MEKTEQLPNRAKRVNMQPRRHRVVLFIAGIALVCAILAIAELGFTEHEINSKLSQIKNGVAALQDQAQLNRSSIQQVNDTVTNLQTTFQQQQNTVGQLQQLVSGKQSTWIAAQLNYLVDLADYNLRYTRDVSSSVALLRTADQRLVTLNETGFVNVRRLLSKSIAALLAVPAVDEPGILLRINTVQDQVAQLPLKLPGAAAADEEEKVVAPDESLPAWRRGLQASWHTIQKVIVVRRINNPIAPLPSAEQQMYLQQNLQLLLQQARLAVLRNQQAVYQKALQQAKELVQQYYDPQVAVTKAVLQTLSDLQKIDIAPALPDLTQLIQTVQKDAAAKVVASSTSATDGIQPADIVGTNTDNSAKPKKTYRPRNFDTDNTSTFNNNSTSNYYGNGNGNGGMGGGNGMGY